MTRFFRLDNRMYRITTAVGQFYPVNLVNPVKNPFEIIFPGFLAWVIDHS